MIPVMLASGDVYTPKCGDCAAFVALPNQSGVGGGECRRKPPEVFAVPARVATAVQPVQLVAGWPAVSRESCCMEYAPHPRMAELLNPISQEEQKPAVPS